MKIIIFGAAGTGKTTLGQSIAATLNWAYLDSDDYYWVKTNPPFQTKIPLEQRNEKLKADFNNNEKVIVSGSLCTWSKFWDTAFDLGIFLSVPPKIRMERLSNREIDRYGEALKTNEAMKEQSKAFLEWAATYDEDRLTGASIRQHKNWIAAMDCPVFELNGNLSTDEQQQIISRKMEAYYSGT